MTSRKSAIAIIIATTALLGAGTAVAGKHGDYDDDSRPGCEHRGGKHGYHQYKRNPDRDLELSAEEAKTLVSARLIQRGNDRLKVGTVKQGEDDTWIIDIVTVDDSLVRTVTISSKTGYPVRPGHDDEG